MPPADAVIEHFLALHRRGQVLEHESGETVAEDRDRCLEVEFGRDFDETAGVGPGELGVCAEAGRAADDGLADPVRRHVRTGRADRAGE